MNGRTIHLLGIAGSLREGSYNRGLLRAARELLPPRADLQVYDALGEIPPYNEDVRLASEPDVVRDLKARVREADGLIFATPEYNYSVPGVLKNAIDWVARPPDESPLRKKHAVIMGATGIVLWANTFFLAWLPKTALDLATVIHFYEAVLATLAIVVWHFYFVIFDPEVYPMDSAWLTGYSLRPRRAAAAPNQGPDDDNDDNSERA